jgi:RNase H-fold protein (predicted Holliday junction resolvase)
LHESIVGYALAVSLGWTMYNKKIVVYSLAKLLSHSAFKNEFNVLVCGFPFAKQRKTQLKTLPLHQLLAFHIHNVTEIELSSTVL